MRLRARKEVAPYPENDAQCAELLLDMFLQSRCPSSRCSWHPRLSQYPFISSSLGKPSFGPLWCMKNPDLFHPTTWQLLPSSYLHHNQQFQNPWFQVQLGLLIPAPTSVISPLAMPRPELGAYAKIYPPIRENEAQ